MCWCNPSIRTPCCGGEACHPSQTDMKRMALNSPVSIPRDLFYDTLAALQGAFNQEQRIAVANKLLAQDKALLHGS